jgi:DNA-binding FadR family transcriptional regulator
MIESLPRIGSRERHSEQIYWVMVDWLAESEAQPGERLPSEAELAEQFGVSRPTMREAIRVLEYAGLVEARRGRNGGLFIGQGSVPQVIGALRTIYIIGNRSRESLREARAIIEVGVTRLAATRITPEQLSILAATIERMTNDQSIESIRASNRLFHLTIADASGNEIMRSIMIALHSLLGEMGGKHAPDEYETFALKTEGHRAILAALTEGNPAAAAEAMSVHLETMAEQSRRLYGREGEADTRRLSVEPIPAD